MKVGVRKPSIKRSIKERTTGSIKRKAKSAVNPFYGKKGMGLVNNPKKAVYNHVYNKTTVGVSDLLDSGSSNKKSYKSNGNAPKVSSKSATFYKIMGIVMIVLGVLLLIVNVFIGLIAIGIGILELRASKKILSKQQEELEAELEREEKRIQKEKAEAAAKQAEREYLDSIPEFQIKLSDEERSRRSDYPADDIKFTNITKRSVYPDFVVFDVETTGLAPYKDRIIEIGAIKYLDGEPVMKFHTMVNPNKSIPEDATNVNHITDEMVKEAPTISQILPSFEEFVGNLPLVGHNLDFDLRFIYYSGSTITDQKRKYYDTLSIAQRRLKAAKWSDHRGSYNDFDVFDHKLGTLCDYYHINYADAHKADADALATGKLFKALIKDGQIQ